MSNLFDLLYIEIFDFIGIWCLYFGICIILGGRASPHMKLHVAGTVNRLNVEHRTPNIER